MGARAAGHRANGADRAGPTSPRRGGVYVGESRRGDTSRPAAPTAPAYRGSDDDHPIAPTIALAGAGGLRHTALGWGSGPADTPTKGGSRGRLPRESGYQDWPAANDPQTPSVPGPNGPRASVIPAMWGSRAFLSTARNEPGTGARRMSRGSRARPLLDAPNTVDSLDDPTKDAARRPLESRNHGWDGRLPPEAACLAGKKWPAQSSHATRGDAALAFHIEPPTSTGPTSCGQTFPGPDLAGGGPFCMGWSVRQPARPYKVGLSGSPVAWAARGLGQLAPSRARAQGRSWPTAPAPGLPPARLPVCPPQGSPPTGHPRGARARLPLTPVPVCLDKWPVYGARAPGLYL
ncbi:uncharacterized protein P174DRAFT_426131 [Aspergillus novofumigatus IBT 16806]|uniref:Uncharacterized protein n=1 Tax=Aspergillus novofumigatus (strain IBT 16806) TaxID=1392255 RepID=A0A2I1BSB9_ASPN1|nr:uncharacterized protein P174DRAFT_426131 [Aspergillus novofumigatus IBT 16806]PKX88279.1 hypothetical protein P174DRAFT_426131 [Aspergillus novofumigatus IBT 16806]